MHSKTSRTWIVVLNLDHRFEERQQELVGGVVRRLR